MTMLPRGYSMNVPFPPGSGDIELQHNSETIKRFPYSTTDAAVIRFAVQHKQGK